MRTKKHDELRPKRLSTVFVHNPTCDVVGCIFEVECSVGGFLILKQIIAIYLIITTLKWCKSSQTVGHHFKFLSLRKPFMLGKNGIKVFDHIFPQ
jgi:hypothetical protein